MAGTRFSLAPPPPRVRLCLGVTGHRDSNLVFSTNGRRISQVLDTIFETISRTLAEEPTLPGAGALAPTRLHSLLSDGLDQMAARKALARGWELVAPLPFGRRLNAAINALPETLEEGRALLGGADDCCTDTLARAREIRELEQLSTCFELAERDSTIEALFLARLEAPNDVARAHSYSAHVSERVELATRVLIEQSDIVIGVWDGVTTSHIGGTGHTVATALEMGAPVIWIDPARPEAWRILHAPESLASVCTPRTPDIARNEALRHLIRTAIRPAESEAFIDQSGSIEGLRALDDAGWSPHSSSLWHAYRRAEAIFGADDWAGAFRSLRQTYETPEAIAKGSGEEFLKQCGSLPGQDAQHVERIERSVLRRFAWADGISARLSDSYRGGMVLNFIFSAFAVVIGLAYVPFSDPHQKWIFASIEALLLTGILVITFAGRKWRWHTRWFETRRVAEYFRHGAILLLLGTARAPGRWPRGAGGSWPEWYARHGLREVGLPNVAISDAYLRGILDPLLKNHVTRQRDYHRAKAERLARVHEGLDMLSGLMFTLATGIVASYLVLKAGGALGLIDEGIASTLSSLFTFLGVSLPTFGGGIAGIRYFGDFERFSAISEVTSEKLDAVAGRIELLLSLPDAAIDYAFVAELAHVTDDIVVGEIENWQAVFGGKHISLPV